MSSRRRRLRAERSDQIEAELEQAGLDVMDYDSRWAKYRVRLLPGEVEKHRDLLSGFMNRAYEEHGN